MRQVLTSIVAAGLVVGSLAALVNAQAPAAPQTPVTFAKDIQPVLEKSCLSCHSADLKLADLDLSTREAAMLGGTHGAVLVPGSADRSKLYRCRATRSPLRSSPR
jgi:hypothetical protein